MALGGCELEVMFGDETYGRLSHCEKKTGKEGQGINRVGTRGVSKIEKGEFVYGAAAEEREGTAVQDHVPKGMIGKLRRCRAVTKGIN